MTVKLIEEAHSLALPLVPHYNATLSALDRTFDIDDGALLSDGEKEDIFSFSKMAERIPLPSQRKAPAECRELHHAVADVLPFRSNYETRDLGSHNCFIIPNSFSRTQHTIAASIGCVGVGLHTGSRIQLELRPADIDSGIVFVRSDLDNLEIPCRFENLVESRLNTSVARADIPSARVGSIEHIMAALSAIQVDNVSIYVNGPEIPALDGSASPFVFLLDCAGLVDQIALQSLIEVVKPVRVESNFAFAELRPRKQYCGLDISLSIAFDAPAIGRQALSLSLTPELFRSQLADARTFALAADVAEIQAQGLARGGSLQNAVVVDDTRILNPGGLRVSNEFVRHKVLDAIGDLQVAGAPIIGQFVGHRSGHSLNRQLLISLFSDSRNWRRVFLSNQNRYSEDELGISAA